MPKGLHICSVEGVEGARAQTGPRTVTPTVPLTLARNKGPNGRAVLCLETRRKGMQRNQGERRAHREHFQVSAAYAIQRAKEAVKA